MNKKVRKFLHEMKMQWYNAQISIGGAWRFFCKQQKAMAGKIASEYYTGNTRTEDTSVVFTCNGWIWRRAMLMTIYLKDPHNTARRAGSACCGDYLYEG